MLWILWSYLIISYLVSFRIIAGWVYKDSLSMYRVATMDGDDWFFVILTGIVGAFFGIFFLPFYEVYVLGIRPVIAKSPIVRKILFRIAVAIPKEEKLRQREIELQQREREIAKIEWECGIK